MLNNLSKLPSRQCKQKFDNESMEQKNNSIMCIQMNEPWSRD